MAKPRKSFYLWIAGKALYWLLGFGIFLMTAFLLWRIYFSGLLPKEMKRLAVNDELKAAYAVHGDEIKLLTQEQGTHTRTEENYGYFAVPRFVFIPEANQVQVIFRYNNSTLKYTQQKYELAERPPRGEEIFDVSLVSVCDLTPEDKADNVDGSETLGKTRVAPTSYEVTTTKLYTYFCYTFDGVSVTPETITVFFDIYYKGDLDYDKPAYGTLRLYHNEEPWQTVKLTARDRKALGE
ncbi:MAG: hypothetical protein IJC99_03565 [Clostridia bacterium]|nr:hypothetical protein [Clostridia bacterium]